MNKFRDIIAASVPWPRPPALDFGKRMDVLDGQPIYVGLSVEETAELRAYELSHQSRRENRPRFKFLDRKHEAARLARIGGAAVVARAEDDARRAKAEGKLQ